MRSMRGMLIANVKGGAPVGRACGGRGGTGSESTVMRCDGGSAHCARIAPKPHMSGRCRGEAVRVSGGVGGGP